MTFLTYSRISNIVYIYFILLPTRKLLIKVITIFLCSFLVELYLSVSYKIDDGERRHLKEELYGSKGSSVPYIYIRLNRIPHQFYVYH